ncbi:MAG: 4'-phosphopantetheinyl transferase superfamily protein [Ferruginibacter sp.]|nr:4'-phosphopantetheinyl transferase superfamily protein [Ferruginibacter sp.]
MPLIYQHQINSATKIGVWHITEAENFFLDQVPLQRNITHPHKRLQHLAGRYLLRELYPEFPLSLIIIADTRKPFLQNDVFHFSISHCGNYAAAIVSTQNRVGVDIEIPHAKIEKIQHKFLSEKEKNLLTNMNGENIKMLTMAWSIKEAMFKWYGVGQVDFIKDMKIVSISRSADGITADCIFKKELNDFLKIENTIVEGINLSWVVTDD